MSSVKVLVTFFSLNSLSETLLAALSYRNSISIYSKKDNGLETFKINIMFSSKKWEYVPNNLFPNLGSFLIWYAVFDGLHFNQFWSVVVALSIYAIAVVDSINHEYIIDELNELTKQVNYITRLTDTPAKYR